MADEVMRAGVEYSMLPQELVLDKAVSPLAVRVYAVIDRLCGVEDLDSVPRRVCELLGASEGTVGRAIKGLRDAGWLSVEKGGGGHPSSYYLHSIAGDSARESERTDAAERANVSALPLAFSDAPNNQEQEQQTSGPQPKVWDPEVLRLCDLFADLYHDLGNKRPNATQETWRTECRRLLTIDGPDGSGWTPQQVETIMRWSLADEFWSVNIRSIPKLRAKFDQLRAARNRDLTRRQQADQRDRAARTDADWMSRTTTEVPE